MKRISSHIMASLCILLSFFCIWQLEAQTIQTSATQILLCPGDTGVVSVNVTGLQNVASISLTLGYDSSKVSYVNYSDAHPALSNGMFLVNDTDEHVKIAWFSVIPVSMGASTLVKLRFVHRTGYGWLQWDTASPGACQYSDDLGQLLPAAFTDGYLSSPGSTVVHPDNDTITPYDTASFHVMTIGTTLTYRWQENTGSGWLDVFNSFFYQGATTSHLRVIKPTLAFNGRQYRCRTTGTCPPPGNLDFSLPATLSVIPPCQNPTAFAGNDTLICSGDLVLLHGAASHYQSISWSGGDGVFSQPNSLITTYDPGVNDILAGGVSISLTAYAFPPCTNAIDPMLVSIQTCIPNQAPYFNQNGIPIDTLQPQVFYATPANICLTLTDPENDSVYLSSVLQYPLHGAISGFFDGDLCFTYSPMMLFTGLDHMVVVGCDIHGECDTLYLLVNVTLPSMNLPPVGLLSGSITDTFSAIQPMNIGGLLCIEAYDPESYPVDLSALLVAPLHGSINGLADGDTCAYYTPDSLFLGMDTFTLALCDTAGACSPISFVIQVADFQLPVPPVAMPDSFSLMESTGISCAVLLNDYDLNGDMDTSSLIVVSQPQHGLATTNAGMIDYSPYLYFYGRDSLFYHICDDSGYCDTARVILTVFPVFDLPMPDHFITLEDQTVACTVLDNDQYPYQVLDSASLSVWSLPQHGNVVVDPTNGIILYTPFADYTGSDTFIYRVCDTLQMCGTAVVSLSVLPVNDPPRLSTVNGVPVLAGLPFLIDHCMDVAVEVCLGLTDPEGDTAFVEAVWSVQPAALVHLTGNADTCFLYQPPPGFASLDTVFCVLSDGIDRDTIWIMVQVHPNPDVWAGNDTLICRGSVFNAIDASASAVAEVSWQSLGSGVFLLPSVLQATYIPSMQDLALGQVQLILTGQGFHPCGQVADTVIVMFRDLPEVWLGNDTTLCENYTLILDGGAGHASWLWSTGHTGRYLAVDSLLVGMGTSTISITVTDDYPCSNEDQIAITFIPCPGLSTHLRHEDLAIFPNPSKGMIYLESPGFDKKRPGIRLANIHGVMQPHQLRWIDSSRCTIQTSNLPPGIYILTIIFEGSSLSRKVVLH